MAWWKCVSGKVFHICGLFVISLVGSVWKSFVAWGFSILGLRADASDEDIKRYYRRQAVLVHPDKVTQITHLCSTSTYMAMPRLMLWCESLVER